MRDKWIRIICYLVVICLTALLVCLLFRGCNALAGAALGKLFPDGRGDWAYQFSGGYSIVRVNGSEIVLCQDSRPILPTYIAAFCYTERYIGLIQTESKEAAVSSGQYYLLDTETGELSGPLDADGYQAKVDELQIFGFTEWIDSGTLSPADIPEEITASN